MFSPEEQLDRGVRHLQTADCRLQTTFIDCSQPLYERARKKSRASAKHAGGGVVFARAKKIESKREARGGGGVGFASEASKKK